ncbi:MAG: hypothetical protein DMG65_16545 [Candidatus Angelobacter sp. Gp1-AA117]|nr:MAG: hypothetical protein DMG65_16545 [Candidatus Angelobacter sp. Gp1-AA117]
MANAFLTFFEDDPKQIELVNTVTEKTLQGKLLWNKSTTTYEATLPNRVELIFALSNSFLPFVKTKTWAHFVVRQPNGNDVLKIEQTSSFPFPQVENVTKSRLETAVERLFDIVNNAAKGEVEKVIDQLKNL